MRYNLLLISALIVVNSCGQPDHSEGNNATSTLPSNIDTEHITHIETGNTTPDELLAFAKTLTGVPYKYASTDPQQGFDCSGFITYVFNHFNIAVPRMSVDFTNVKHEVPINDAKPGDLVLFTGTDSTSRVVGHMGIVTVNPGKAEDIAFIHSTSGKANGVTETPMNIYYQKRYVKTIRIFPQNEK